MFFLKLYVSFKLTINIFKYWEMIIFMEMDTIFPKFHFLFVTTFFPLATNPAIYFPKIDRLTLFFKICLKYLSMIYYHLFVRCYFMQNGFLWSKSG